MKDLIDVWFDLLSEEATKNNNTFLRIQEEENPLLYKWNEIMNCALHAREGILIGHKEQELYEKFLSNDKNNPKYEIIFQKENSDV